MFFCVKLKKIQLVRMILDCYKCIKDIAILSTNLSTRMNINFFTNSGHDVHEYIVLKFRLKYIFFIPYFL